MKTLQGNIETAGELYESTLLIQDKVMHQLQVINPSSSFSFKKKPKNRGGQSWEIIYTQVL